LVSLKKLDSDYLKIGKSFINYLLPGSSGKVLCKAIMLMAHGLGLKVIAEGVETQEQCSFLKSKGVTMLKVVFSRNHY
jgi:sensor c-di-GMP phosphodiesterase-like protein